MSTYRLHRPPSAPAAPRSCAPWARGNAARTSRHPACRRSASTSAARVVAGVVDADGSNILEAPHGAGQVQEPQGWSRTPSSNWCWTSPTGTTCTPSASARPAGSTPTATACCSPPPVLAQRSRCATASPAVSPCPSWWTTTPTPPPGPSGASAPAAARALVTVTLGTGIGGAILEDGQVKRGKYGVAGEFGHMQVVPGGHRCRCGNPRLLGAVQLRQRPGRGRPANWRPPTRRWRTGSSSTSRAASATSPAR